MDTAITLNPPSTQSPKPSLYTTTSHTLPTLIIIIIFPFDICCWGPRL